GLGLDVPSLLDPLDGPRSNEQLRLHGTVTIHDGGTILRVSPQDLRSIFEESVATMALPRGARVWNAFSAGAPCAMVPGALVPIPTGCELVDAIQDAHTAVAPIALLRRLARGPGAVPGQVVAADGLLDAPTVDAFAARGVRVLAQPFLDLR